ncbi:MAG: cupin domain-containing protein [Patescibacteria group bacterium]
MKKINIADVIEMGVRQNPKIKKKVLIDRGEVPRLMVFGQATFQPGQTVAEHQHETMFEIFFIQSGRADFIIDGQKVELKTGDCLTIVPGEMHAQTNPYDEKVTWLYFGVATE